MSQCRCNCGYTCGGPGRCELRPLECLAAGHFKVDCGHQWDGPIEEGTIGDGCFYSTGTCSKCGATQMGHDMYVGP